jgi:lipid II:glycine glycyltransferase (peptidoglycan interpeptide bridge formation enzyme)
LFRNCHKDSTQRKIQRAEREGLRYEEGRSEALVDAFYDLQIITRRRHGLPPQPKQWFRNVAECLGAAAQFRVAYKDRQPVAAILTIRHKQTMMYKYGCSDAACNHLGGIHLLLWKTIEDAKRGGLRTLDLGRSDLDSDGLITFKDRWGSQRSVLCYWLFTGAESPKGVYESYRGRTGSWPQKVFTHTPEMAASRLGEWLYRHIG